MLDQTAIDRHWMTLALSLADKAKALGEVPVGAVVVDADNHLIGEGWNQPIASHDPSAHAEIMAIRAAAQTLKNYRLPNTTLYVTIEPCAMCAGAMLHARINRLVFAALEPKAGAVISHQQLLSQPQNNHSVEVCQGVMQAEASALISNFFAAKRAAKKAL